MVTCPFCEAAYDSEEITVEEIGDEFVVYSCPRCTKILNVSYIP